MPYILGWDPGTHSGWAIADLPRARLVAAGQVDLPNRDLIVCHRMIHEMVAEIYAKLPAIANDLTAVVCEDVSNAGAWGKGQRGRTIVSQMMALAVAVFDTWWPGRVLLAPVQRWYPHRIISGRRRNFTKAEARDHFRMLAGPTAGKILKNEHQAIAYGLARYGMTTALARGWKTPLPPTARDLAAAWWRLQAPPT